MTCLHDDEASSSDPPPPHTTSDPPPPDHTTSLTYIGAKAKEILATHDITGITRLVSNLCYGKETEQSPSSSLLYKSFAKHFPNILALKLIQVYRLATDLPPKIRSFSLHLLDSVLIDLDQDGLKKACLNEIKTHLNSCLLGQVTSDHQDFKLLSRIVSRVAIDVFISDNDQWEELCGYILSLDGNKEAFLMFSELPTLLDDKFLIPLLENDLGLKIVRALLNQDPEDDEEWCLALEAAFSLMLQLVYLKRKHLVPDLVYVIVKSIWEMVNVQRRELVVRKGFVRIARKIRRDAIRFDEPEYDVVTGLGSMVQKINGVGEVTKMVVKLIQQTLERYYMGGTDVDYGLLSQYLCVVGVNVNRSM